MIQIGIPRWSIRQTKRRSQRCRLAGLKEGEWNPGYQTPLPSLLSVQQWDILKSLNRDTTKRIHDAQLPRTNSQKPFIVLPHTKFTKTEYVDALKSIAAIIGVVPTEDERMSRTF